MKKTFRWLLCVLMAVTMAGTAAMAACAEDNKPPAHTEHVDADGDGKCDECGKDMGKTPEDPNDPDNPDGPVTPMFRLCLRERSISLKRKIRMWLFHRVKGVIPEWLRKWGLQRRIWEISAQT